MISPLHQEAAHALLHQLRRAAHAGRNDREPRGHSLGDRVGQAFRGRAKAESVRAREQRRHIHPVPEQEDAALEAQLADALLEERPLRALARANEADTRVAQQGRSLEQDAVGLYRPEVADHRHDEVTLRGGQRRGRLCGELVEVPEVEPVADHDDTVRAATLLLDANAAHGLGVGGDDIRLARRQHFQLTVPLAKSRPQMTEIDAVDDHAHARDARRGHADHAGREVVRVHEANTQFPDERRHPQDLHGRFGPRQPSQGQDVRLVAQRANGFEERAPRLEAADQRLEPRRMPPEPLDQLSLGSSIVEPGQEMEDPDGPHGLLHGLDRQVPAEEVGHEAPQRTQPLAVVHGGDGAYGRGAEPPEHRAKLIGLVRLGAFAFHVVGKNVRQRTLGPPLQQGVPHPELVGDQRVSLIEHSDELAARPQDAVDLVDDLLWTLGWVNDAPELDDVEGGIGKRQRLRVDALELRMEAVQREMAPRRLDGGVGEIHAVTHCASFRPLDVIDAGTHADLQQAGTLAALEPRDFRDVRFLLVAVPLDGLEPFGALPLFFPGDPGTRSARFSLPVSPYRRLSHGCPSPGKTCTRAVAAATRSLRQALRQGVHLAPKHGTGHRPGLPLVGSATPPETQCERATEREPARGRAPVRAAGSHWVQAPHAAVDVGRKTPTGAVRAREGDERALAIRRSVATFSAWTTSATRTRVKAARPRTRATARRPRTSPSAPIPSRLVCRRSAKSSSARRSSNRRSKRVARTARASCPTTSTEVTSTGISPGAATPQGLRLSEVIRQSGDETRSSQSSYR